MALHLIIDEEMLDELSVDGFLEIERVHWRQPLPVAVAKKCKSPGFAPSTIQTRQIESLVDLGFSDVEIAEIMLIELILLRFYYRHELAAGAAKVNAKVGHVALKMALSERDHNDPILAQNPCWMERNFCRRKEGGNNGQFFVGPEKLLGPRPATPDNVTIDNETGLQVINDE